MSATPTSLSDLTNFAHEWFPVWMKIYSFVDEKDILLESTSLIYGRRKISKECIDIKLVKCWYQNKNCWDGSLWDDKNFIPELLLNDDSLIKVDHKKKENYVKLRYPDRIVYENNTWLIWATSSPRRNFHLRLATKRHIERITDLDNNEIEGLADALIISSKALDAVGISADRNVIIYSNPYGYSSYFHLFIDILPFEKLGGIELLDSTRVARYSPRDVAEELRKTIKQTRHNS